MDDQQPENGDSVKPIGSAASVWPLQKEQEQWKSEVSDLDWTQNTKNYLKNMLDPDWENVVRAVECRTSLCRIELEQDDLEALRNMDAALRNDGYRFSYAFNDQSQVVVFLRRDSDDDSR